MIGDEKMCPDCKSSMVEGFILDISDGNRLVPRWLKGRPEKSAWMGVKASGKECRTVVSFRCEQCGLLRSYATDEVSTPSFFSGK